VNLTGILREIGGSPLLFVGKSVGAPTERLDFLRFFMKKRNKQQKMWQMILIEIVDFVQKGEINFFVSLVC
jgi:hypothetical protein